MIDLITLVLIVLLPLVLYLFLNRNVNYWKSRNVPYIPPVPILGNLKPLIFLKRSVGQFLGDLYNAPEAQGQRFVGIFIFNNKPALLVRDPDLLKNILVKDFQHFANRSVECNEKLDPLGANNLFVVRDAKWKYLRSKMAPVFSSGKIKQMFHLIKETAEEFLGFIDNNLGKSADKQSFVLESKGALGRYTVDVITTCAFGIKSNSIKNPASQFGVFGKKVFATSARRSLELLSLFFASPLAKVFHFYFFQTQSTKFFRQVFAEVIQEREKKEIVRSDLIDTLIKLKQERKTEFESKTEEEKKEICNLELFDLDILVAQSSVFFTAGFETTSSTISFALYELALQQHLQDRLREEILKNKEANAGEFTYEGVFQMKYLDMVIAETLRKYPSMPFLDRICTMDYKIPDSDVIIRKGTPVFISMYNGLHYDKNYFPEPEKFDPERFTEENKKNWPAFSYLPFGEGPHGCIGVRFGRTNIKLTLSKLLSTYRVETCEQTEIPLQISERSLVIAAKNGIHLRFVKL